MAKMKVNDFINKAKDIAKNYKTLYVMGCFGAPLNATNKKRYTTNSSYNKQADRKNMINAASSDTFGFDCVCFIKGILWGWKGNKNHIYGGADYTSNGVPDFGADDSMKYCTNVSTNFSKVDVGEIVWMKGHVGIYVGNSEIVECAPAFKNKVQITKLSQRKWLKHGKLKYIDYSSASYYPKSSYKGTSIVEALNKLKINSSYSYRAKIAAKNGIKNYQGTATQNIKMLNLLKSGKLKKV